jgi:hypothetical protein
VATNLKAVKIDKQNKATLESQYNMDRGFLEYSSGLYLLAEFGATQYLGIFTKVGLETRYVVGKKLDNGFFEVEKKVA